MTANAHLVLKVSEVREEMLRTGIWQVNPPLWIKKFSENQDALPEDFIGWLQFVYLPNRLQEAVGSKLFSEQNCIGPQAARYFGNDILKGRLLQLLIELDSI